MVGDGTSRSKESAFDFSSWEFITVHIHITKTSHLIVAFIHIQGGNYWILLCSWVGDSTVHCNVVVSIHTDGNRHG